MALRAQIDILANYIVRRFGVQVSRVGYPPDDRHGLGISRVTMQGMAKAINRAHTLFPERKVVAFVDCDTDASGMRFDQGLGVVCERITGDPRRDLSTLDLGSTSLIFGFDSDEKVTAYLDYVTRRNGKYFCSYDIRNARWWHLRDTAKAVLLAEKEDCIRNHHSHFAPDQLANLMQAIDITRGYSGDYVEIGVFKGTSARLAYHYMKATQVQRICYFIDTFAGFNYAVAMTSSDAHWQGTHDASLEHVARRLEAAPSYNGPQPTFKLVKSNIVQDELPAEISSIVMCNIDVDIYDAVLAALRKTWPLLIQRGICVVQDPGRTPRLGGARLALDHFLREVGSQECQAIYLESGQTFLTKC